MVLFSLPFAQGPVKSTDEVQVRGKVQSGSLGMVLHPCMVIFIQRV